jgi:ubiquinone/menaquinone biosynthesis C-methylase UbiE
VEPSHTIAAAADLPFEKHSFDLAVACNVLMKGEDVPAALKETLCSCFRS